VAKTNPIEKGVAQNITNQLDGIVGLSKPKIFRHTAAISEDYLTDH
jgi:hypothetical protein